MNFKARTLKKNNFIFGFGRGAQVGKAPFLEVNLRRKRRRWAYHFYLVRFRPWGSNLSNFENENSIGWKRPGNFISLHLFLFFFLFVFCFFLKPRGGSNLTSTVSGIFLFTLRKPENGSYFKGQSGKDMFTFDKNFHSRLRSLVTKWDWKVLKDVNGNKDLEKKIKRFSILGTNFRTSWQFLCTICHWKHFYLVIGKSKNFLRNARYLLWPSARSLKFTSKRWCRGVGS